MLKPVILPALCAAIAFSSVATAQAEREGFYVNLGAGMQFFASDRDLDDEVVLMLGGEYRFTPNWAAEVRYYDSEVSPETGDDIDLQQYGVDALYYFNAGSKFEPYALLGVGEVSFDTDPSDDELQFAFGGGVRAWLSDNVSARFDLRGLLTDEEEDLDSIASVGISYHFGGAKEAAPVAAAAVVAAAAPVEADSDGDGVVDSKDACPGTPKGTVVDAKGCATAVTERVSFSLDIKFENDSAVVKQESYDEVADMAAFLKAYGSVAAVIEGHTDSNGSDAYNQKLSQRRAQAVVDRLVAEHGVDAARLTAKGLGEVQPIADNANAEGRAANRRVVAVMEAQAK